MKTNSNLEKIINQSKKYRYLYLCGAAGVGKTTLLMRYQKWLRSRGKECLLLDMEVQADRQRLMQCLEETESGPREDGRIIQNMPEAAGSTAGDCMLLVDQLHFAAGEELRKLAEFMERKKGRIHILFTSRKEPPEVFFTCLYKEYMKEIIGIWDFLDRKDIAELAKGKGIRLGQEQIDGLYNWSMGWPAIVEIAVFIVGQEKGKTELDEVAGHPILLDYIEKNIWDYLMPKQQEACRQLAVLPYVPVSEGEEINRWLIQTLVDLYLLRKSEKGYYFFAGFLRDFLVNRNLVTMAEREILEKAGDWLQERGLYREAVECYFTGRNVEKHRECMWKAYEMLPWEMDNRRLHAHMEFSLKREQDGRTFFLRGMQFLDQGDFKRTKKVIEYLKQNYREAEDEKREAGLLYLNLLYYYPEVSVKDWIEEALKVVAEIGPIHIYSLNCGKPGCLCEGKELSELFCCRKRETERYRQQWNHIFEKEQQDFFSFAEAEYLMETNRQEEAFEKLEPFLVLEEDMMPDRMEVLFGLLCNLYMRGGRITGYEKLVEEYYCCLTGRNPSCREWNVTSLKAYYDIWCRKDQTQADNPPGNDSEDYRVIERNNCYYLLNKARNYLFSRQSEKAYMLFGRLGEYYNRNRLYRFRTECCMGQAVAAYGMDEEIQALKLLSIAMATAERFRYVGVFSLFGNTGKNLLEKYCAVTPELAENLHGVHGGKRNYYYGNVVGVSVQNYMKVLMRAARKNASRYPFESAGSTVAYETLTATEVSILQYVEQGYANSEIARELNIEVTTVKKHIYNIYKKLEVNNRVQAVQKGKMMGILMK